MAKKKSEADSESKSKEKKKSESDEPKSSVLRECPDCHLITRNKICPDCGAETEPVSTFFIPRSKARIPFEANDLLSTVAHEELNDVLQQYYLERAKAALAEAKLRRQETEAKLNTATATTSPHAQPHRQESEQPQSQTQKNEGEKEKEGVFSWEAISLMPEEERERFLEYLAENPRAAALLSILNSKQYALAPALFLLNAAEQKKDGDSTSELIQAVSNFINNLQQNNNNQSISELINAIQEIQKLTQNNDGNNLTESLLRHAIDKLSEGRNRHDENDEIQEIKKEIQEIKETLRNLTQPPGNGGNDAFSFLNNAIETLKKLKDSFADFYAPDWKERASFTHQLKLEEMERQRLLAKEEQDANRFKALATLFDLLHHRLQQQQQQQSEEEQQQEQEEEDEAVEVQGDLKHRVAVKVS